MILSMVRRTFVDRTASHYSILQRSLHWLVVVMCLSQVPTSWAIARSHVAHFFNREPSTYDLVLHQVHIWSGIAIALLTCLRLILRFVHGVPPLPEATRATARLAAGTMHFLLYALLGLSPAAGFMAAYVDGRFGAIHSWLNWTLLWLACLHAASGLWHHFVKRDNVLARMLRAGGSKG